MRPTPRLLKAALIWAALALAAVVSHATTTHWLAPQPWDGLAFQIWLVITVALLAAVAADWLLLRYNPAPLQGERRVSDNLAIGAWHHVTLSIHNQAHASERLTVLDHHPQAAEAAELPQTHSIPAGQALTLSYALRIHERGPQDFQQIHAFGNSPLGFWEKRYRLGKPTRVNVYPNFTRLQHYFTLALDNQLGQIGIKRQPRRGQGLEFHQLREYREGDSIRQIDWKATARATKPIAREYQDERDQSVVLMLDAGRRMRSHDRSLGHFDHCLNSALLLGYAALKEGDAVGLMSHSVERRWLAPEKGVNQINRLLNRVYDLFPSAFAADYAGAAHELLQRQQKRALVMMVANLRDEDEEDLRSALQVLRRRHLVVLANLREQALDETLEEDVGDFSQALRYAGAERFLERNGRFQRKLSLPNVLVVDTAPDELPQTLINTYFQIKRQGRL